MLSISPSFLSCSVNQSCFKALLKAVEKAQWRTSYSRSSAQRGRYCPQVSRSPPQGFHSASMSRIINISACIVQLVGEARCFLQRGQMHISMGTSCYTLMHLRALTSIKRDNGQLSCAFCRLKRLNVWGECGRVDVAKWGGHYWLDLCWSDSLPQRSHVFMGVVWHFGKHNFFFFFFTGRLGLIA